MRLEQEIRRRTGKLHNPHGGGNTYELERSLGQDPLLTSVGWANNDYQTCEPGEEYVGEWGGRLAGRPL